MQPRASRRQFLGGLGAALSTCQLSRAFSPEPEPGSRKAPIGVIHATDLFRPHCDPDDHWDLACVFALAHGKAIDLKGVLIDFAPRQAGNYNPDVMAVAQMNYITGLHVPVSVGCPHRMRSRDDRQPYADVSDHVGIDMVLDILRRSAEPVVINVTGSCRDIAVAGKKAPELFAQKCAGIYLNAGTGSPDKAQAAQLEYNVSLAPLSYAAIFDLPCPIYWLPCFEQTKSDRVVMEYGTHYRFRQGEILGHLSTKMQNFFLYMLSRKVDHNWLQYLRGPVQRELLEAFGAKDRHMWCTAGFLHAAGRSVTRCGQIVPLGRGPEMGVFSFDPVKIECSNEGVTAWTHDVNSADRYIFRVRDIGSYQQAMTRAMKALLRTLP